MAKSKSDELELDIDLTDLDLNIGDSLSTDLGGGLDLDLGDLDIGIGNNDTSGGSRISRASPSQSRSSSYIAPENRYQKEEGFLEHTLGALDYLGNASRSAIVGARTGQGLQHLEEALKKERATSPEQLRKAFGGTNFGESDGEFQWGDILDVGQDLAVGAVTDPLSLLSMGIGQAAKGTGRLAQSINKAKLGDKTTAFAKAKAVGVPALGALYGVGSGDAGDSALETAGRGLAGAAIAAGGRKASPHIKKALVGNDQGTGGLFGEISKRWGKRFGPRKDKLDEALIDDLPETKYLAKEGFAERAGMYKGLLQRQLQLIENLDPQKQDLMEEFMLRQKDKNIALRNEIWKKEKKRLGFTKEDKDGPVWQAATAGVSKEANEAIRRGLDDDWKAFVQEKKLAQADDVYDSVKGWFKANEEHIKDVKQFQMKETGRVSHFEGVAAHWPEIFKDQFDEKRFLKAIKNGEVPDLAKRKMAKKTSAERKSQALGRDPNLTPEQRAKYRRYAMEIYASDESYKFLDKAKRKAMKDMSAYHSQTDPLSTSLKYFDGVTNYIKRNLLFGSTTWHINNYFDNLAKAYLEGGLGNLAKVGSFGAFQKGLSKDVWRSMKGEIHPRDLTPYMDDAVKYGVLDGPLFKSMDDQYVNRFFGKEEAPAKGLAKIPEAFKKVGEWHGDILRRTSGQVGSTTEGIARLVTYKHNLDFLKKALPGVPEEEIKKRAAKIVNDTYFDYSNITHFENAVLKRFIPFYSFYRHNLPYWVKSLHDVEKVGRLANVERFRKEFGSPLNERDRQGMPKYLETKAPRRLGENKQGTQYAFSPSFSLFDALNQVGGGKGLQSEATEKLHPGMKLGYELFTGKDTFTGGNLYPSDERSGKKYLFSRGHKMKFVQDAIDFTRKFMDGGKESLGVYVDDRGNPVATSDLTVGIDRAAQLFAPAPLGGMADKVFGSEGKLRYGKESPDQTILNFVSPVRSVNVTNRQRGANIRRERMEERLKEIKRRKLEREKQRRTRD